MDKIEAKKRAKEHFEELKKAIESKSEEDKKDIYLRTAKLQCELEVILNTTDCNGIEILDTMATVITTLCMQSDSQLASLCYIIATISSQTGYIEQHKYDENRNTKV